MTAYFIHFGHWQYVCLKLICGTSRQARILSFLDPPILLWESIYYTIFSPPVLPRCSLQRSFPFLLRHQNFGFAQTKLVIFPTLYYRFYTVARIFHPYKPLSALLYEKSWILALSRRGSKHHFYHLLVHVLLNLIRRASVSLSRQWHSFAA